MIRISLLIVMLLLTAYSLQPTAYAVTLDREYVEKLFLEEKYDRAAAEAGKLIDANSSRRDELYYLKGLSEMKTNASFSGMADFEAKSIGGNKITKVDNELVEVIDVEKVLAEIVPYDTSISAERLADPMLERARGREVLCVDDSTVALSQLRETLSQLGLKVHTASDGLKGLNMLKAWADAGEVLTDKLLMVFTDAEMPEMDGYRLTTEIRHDPRLRDLYVVLHTSLSGSFNLAMVQKVGCDNFLSKFQPEKLVDVIQDRLKMEEQD